MNPQAFYIKNHSASDLHKSDVAALHTLSTRPQFATKELFAQWCHDSQTEHVFYTLAEPEVPSLRASGSNKIKFLHGIVADYDGAADAIQASLPKLKFGAGLAPAWITTTFSNKARLLWLFEKPVPTFSPEVVERFLKLLKKELKLSSHLAGLDEVAYFNPYTPYELGTDWRQPFGDVRLPHAMVTTLLHDASQKTQFKSEDPEIPLETVQAEVEKKFPGRWKGAFVAGAKGVRFWDAAADNPTGCTIRENGVQAWTGEAKFMPWSEVLGQDFVKQFRQNRIGGAIDGVYYDGQTFWQKDGQNIWRDFGSDAMKRRLKSHFQISGESRRGQASELDLCMTSIEDTHTVDGAFPCLFRKEDVVREGPMKFLNISRVGTMNPATGQVREWGDGFPWLAAYLKGLMRDEKQFDVFMSWLAGYYNTARVGQPKRPHAMFFAGPVGIGKTLLSDHVIGGIMGGSESATRFMLGDTHFNESLFHRPVWAIDDAEAGTDPKRHALYSQMVKKFVANPKQEYHPKFKKAVTHRFDGCLVVTLNDDPSSMSMLPQIEHSLLDKFDALHLKAPGVSFSGVEAKIRAELPYLCDFLCHWATPAWLLGNVSQNERFGFTAYQDPVLLDHARDASPSTSQIEVIDRWRTLYFRGAKDTQKEWAGTISDLFTDIEATESMAGLFKSTIRDSGGLRRALQTAIKHDLPWVQYKRTATQRLYVIHRPEVLT